MLAISSALLPAFIWRIAFRRYAANTLLLEVTTCPCERRRVVGRQEPLGNLLRPSQEVAKGFSPADDPPSLPRVGDDVYIQVVDATEQVVTSSNNVLAAYRRKAIRQMKAGSNAELIANISPYVKMEDGPFLAVAVAAPASDERLVVIFGKSLEPVAETVRAAVSYTHLR